MKKMGEPKLILTITIIIKKRGLITTRRINEEIKSNPRLNNLNNAVNPYFTSRIRLKASAAITLTVEPRNLIRDSIAPIDLAPGKSTNCD